MLSVAEAERIILNLVQPFENDRDRQWVQLSEARERILAEDIHSIGDIPRWDNAAMDGYALRYLDIDQEPWQLAIASTMIAAGSDNQVPLGQGECMRIFTGGMLPLGADTVIMQEDTEVLHNEMGAFLRLKIKPTQGEYVRHRGEFLKAGARLLSVGTRLGATEIGAIAAVGRSQVQVFRQPKVAIISTGSELVNLAHFAQHSPSLDNGKIIDSNLHALTALVTQSGAIAMPLGAVGDDRVAMRQIFEQAIAEADLIISSGGVSVGDYDYVESLLESLGANIAVRSVAIKPGKPLTVATLAKPASNPANCPVIIFGVPGNPVSAIMSFWRFIQGAIAKLGGAHPQAWTPQFIQAQTTADLHSQGRRETYLWGKLSYVKGRSVFMPTVNYSSGNLVSIIGTNAIAVMRIHQTYVPQGDEVMVMLV